jgi:hypothetical protein
MPCGFRVWRPPRGEDQRARIRLAVILELRALILGLHHAVKPATLLAIVLAEPATVVSPPMTAMFTAACARAAGALLKNASAPLRDSAR